MKSWQSLAIVLSLFASTQAFATWILDPDSSSLTFVSTKAIDIAEVNRFTELAGQISDKGNAIIAIEMASVDSGISIRDERLRELLFETGTYPLAVVSSKIDLKSVDEMSAGDSARMKTSLALEVHGTGVNLEATVIIAKLDDNSLLVTSAEPIILTAASANLTDGIEELRKVANLPSIGNAVPVSFVLLFKKSD